MDGWREGGTERERDRERECQQKQQEDLKRKLFLKVLLKTRGIGNKLLKTTAIGSPTGHCKCQTK
jgi:hypothetical protein